MAQPQLSDAVREAACLLAGSRRDYDPLMALARGARFVLLGESTQGSHEFYRERARITQRLIAERGFNGVLVEADWAEAERANGFVQGHSDDGEAGAALSAFRSFPAWRWRNGAVCEFLEGLRAHNELARPSTALVGIDVYSMYSSLETAAQALDSADPAAAARARERFAALEMYGEGGHAVRRRPAEDEALRQVIELRKRRALSLDPEIFSEGLRARYLRNVEAGSRALFGPRISAWNLRERQLAETIEEVESFLQRRDGYARLVIWAHNAHLGDARATERGDLGELNVGQLLRERHGDAALLVGFTTWGGSVTAAAAWGDLPEPARLRLAPPGSLEELLHEVGLPRFFLPLRGAGPALDGLREPLLERAIGAVYRPEDELESHCFEARVAEQFDALVHIDRTRPVEALEPAGGWAPELVPAGP